MRADLGELPLREVRVALEQLAGDGELEDAVAEELEALVRRRAIGRPGGMRQDMLEVLRREPVDQLLEVGFGRCLAIGAR